MSLSLLKPMNEGTAVFTPGLPWTPSEDRDMQRAIGVQDLLNLRSILVRRHTGGPLGRARNDVEIGTTNKYTKHRKTNKIKLQNCNFKWQKKAYVAHNFLFGLNFLNSALPQQYPPSDPHIHPLPVSRTSCWLWNWYSYDLPPPLEIVPQLPIIMTLTIFFAPRGFIFLWEAWQLSDRKVGFWVLGMIWVIWVSVLLWVQEVGVWG